MNRLPRTGIVAATALCVVALVTPTTTAGQASTGDLAVSTSLAAPALSGEGIQGVGPAPMSALQAFIWSTATVQLGWRLEGLRGGGTLSWSVELPARLVDGPREVRLTWPAGRFCLGPLPAGCVLGGDFLPGETVGGRALGIPRTLAAEAAQLLVMVGARADSPRAPGGVYRGRATLTVSYLN